MGRSRKPDADHLSNRCVALTTFNVTQDEAGDRSRRLWPRYARSVWKSIHVGPTATEPDRTACRRMWRAILWRWMAHTLRVFSVKPGQHRSGKSDREWLNMIGE